MIEFSAVVFLKYKGAKIVLILADYLGTYLSLSSSSNYEGLR
jgi:hypothetical protein